AVAEPRTIDPAELVAIARRRGAQVIASTYNEPLITSEWGVAVLGEAQATGLLGAYVSNGNGTERVLDYIQPHVSLYKVDLKSFRDRVYRSLGGTLEAVLRTIESVWRRGIWPGGVKHPALPDRAQTAPATAPAARAPVPG